MPDRLAARVVLIDRDDCVLLLSGRESTDPNGRQFWFTPGGGAEDGESIVDAAGREVFEETGFKLGEIGPCVWTRHAVFEFEGRRYSQDEQYFVVRVERFEVRRPSRPRLKLAR